MANVSVFAAVVVTVTGAAVMDIKPDPVPVVAEEPKKKSNIATAEVVLLKVIVARTRNGALVNEAVNEAAANDVSKVPLVVPQ